MISFPRQETNVPDGFPLWPAAAPPERSRRATRRTLLVAAFLAVAGSAGVRAAAPVEARAWFSESYRKERLTTHDFNSSVTDEAWNGRLQLDVVLPLAPGAEIDGQTPLALQAGAYRFTGKPADDPDFNPPRKRCRLARIEFTKSGTAVSRPPIVQVEWDAARVKVRVDGKTGWSGGAVAEELAGRAAGPVEGRLPVTARFGDASFQCYLPFRGAVKTRSVRGGKLEGEVTTVEVRATGKRP
jgi:hypothetical protein